MADLREIIIASKLGDPSLHKAVVDPDSPCYTITKGVLNSLGYDKFKNVTFDSQHPKHHQESDHTSRIQLRVRLPGAKKYLRILFCVIESDSKDIILPAPISDEDAGPATGGVLVMTNDSGQSGDATVRQITATRLAKEQEDARVHQKLREAEMKRRHALAAKVKNEKKP
ncbi:hypothetical protein LTR84_009607 [Exophiala bonariae]|uniref:Uncharacterized protein n=1 Tax=Exophiala bonariae TaxID=1690606 RepID=A0AAV9NJR9_9EURO|nr:hypothetical protein LTR84_009607 [Exophiala bonariae]